MSASIEAARTGLPLRSPSRQLRRPGPLSAIPRERLAIWLAALIHGLIIFGITIVFPLKPVRGKPLLVFLGAVLEPQDLNPAREHSRGSGAGPSDMPLVIDSRYRHPAQEVPKPFFAPSLPENQKIYLKSDFLNPEPPAPLSAEWLKDLGIDPMPPPRPRLQDRR